MRLQAGEQGDAFRRPALHFEHVRHGVRAPHVGGIELYRAAAGALRGGVVAGFLEREREAAEKAGVPGPALAPMRRHPLERRAHLGLPAEPEIVGVREAHRQHVARPRDEDFFPFAQRAVQVAGDPALERAHVGLLARRGALGVLRSRAQCVRRGRHGSAAVGEQHEVAPQAMPQGELGIGLQRSLRVLRQVGVVAGEGLEGTIEGVAGDGRRADGQLVGVVHCAFDRLAKDASLADARIRRSTIALQIVSIVSAMLSTLNRRRHRRRRRGPCPAFSCRSGCAAPCCDRRCKDAGAPFARRP